MFNWFRKFINKWKFNQGMYIETMSLNATIPLNKEDKQMKLYHTETQEDFNALLEKLKNEGCSWPSDDIVTPDKLRRWETYEEETVLFVKDSVVTYEDIYCANYYHPDTPIEKYKAKKSLDEPSYRPDVITEGKNNDNVNNPAHYTSGGIETLDYIKAKVSDYPSYAVGNIVKYVSRYEHKNGIEDLKKAQFYLNDLIEWME